MQLPAGSKTWTPHTKKNIKIGTQPHPLAHRLPKSHSAHKLYKRHDLIQPGASKGKDSVRPTRAQKIVSPTRSLCKLVDQLHPLGGETRNKRKYNPTAWGKETISQFSSVQSLSHVRLFVIPWIAARQASLSITNSRSLLKLMPIELVMPSSHFILCRPLLLLPPIPPSIRVFSNKSTLRMR